MSWDKTFHHSCWLLIMTLVWYPGKAAGQTPAQMEAPAVTHLTDSMIEIAFSPSKGINDYLITATPRFGSSTILLRVSNTTAVITNLTSSTIYELSVQAITLTGDVGESGNITTQQTHPGAPIIRSSTPLPTTFLLFLETVNRARISQWTVEYRIERISGPSIVTRSTGGLYYVLRLLGLQPDTTYEVRARASQIYGNKNLQENETFFSDWYKIKTDSLSVFGRVTLISRNFTNTAKWSRVWNDTLGVIKAAYKNFTNINDIDLIQLEEGTGIVYYQIKVKDKEFTDTPTSSYLLIGDEFDDSAVNNGDQTDGIATLIQDKYKDWEFNYETNSNTTAGGITSTYMLVSPEAQSTRAILVRPVGDAGVEGKRTMSFRDESGRYSFDDGELSDENFSPNTVIGFEPKYLIRDYLKTQPTELLYAQYYEMSQSANFRFIRSTDIYSFDISSVAYSTSSDGSTLTISFPSLDKCIQYIVTVNGNEETTIHEQNIDGSPRLTMTVRSLSANTTYECNIIASQRKHDGTIKNVTSSAFTVSTHSDRCSDCSNDATCETAIESGSTTCQCKKGFAGDGKNCAILHTTTTEKPEPTPSPPSTEETSTQQSTTQPTRESTTDETTPGTTSATTTTNDIITTPTTTTPTTTTTTTTAATTTTTMVTSIAPTTTNDPATAISSSAAPDGCQVESDASFVPQRPHLSNTNFTVTWSNVSSKYTVITRCIEEDCDDDDIRYNSTAFPSINLIDLRSGAAYNICIVTEVCESQAFRNKTQCGSFMTNPSSVGKVAIITGLSSVNVSWEAVSGALTYSVSLKPLTTTSSSGRISNEQVKSNISGTSVIFEDLSSCLGFSVELIALNSGGSSIPTTRIFSTTCSTTSLSISTSEVTATILDSTTERSKNTTEVVISSAAVATATTGQLSSTKITSEDYSSTTISTPKISTGPPWWFILAIVLASLIIFACTYGVLRVSNRDENFGDKSVRLLAVRELKASLSDSNQPTHAEPERTRV